MIAQFGVQAQVTRVASRACDVPATVLSCRRAKSVFGWEPQISIERGIQGVGAWLLRDVLRQQPPIQVPTVADEVTDSRLEAHTATNVVDMPKPLQDIALPSFISGVA
jgi:hypothetical protein